MKTFVSAALLLIALSCPQARAGEDATIFALKALSGLEWDNTHFVPRINDSGYRVHLTGKFSLPATTLLYENQPLIKTASEGSIPFSLDIPVSGPLMQLTLMSVDVRGNILQGRYEIRIANWAALEAELKRQHMPSSSRWALGLSYTTISYNQSVVGNLDLVLLTAKTSYQYFFSDFDWSLGASAYATVAPLLSSRGDMQARFYGFNLRAGKKIPWLKRPWSLWVEGGYYYSTMSESPATFGYSNLGGPEIYPVLAYQLDERDQLGAYFKFAPVSNGFGIRQFSDREIGGGVSWRQVLTGTHLLIASMDVANISFAQAGVAISSTSISLGLGYGF